jgi:uncharacterized protein
MRINVFMLYVLSWLAPKVISLTAVKPRLGYPRRSRWQLRFVVFLAVIQLAVLGSGCAWLDVKQRNIIYRPTPGVPTNFVGLRPGDERYFVNVPQPALQDRSANTSAVAQATEQIEMWWLPHPDTQAPTLLYYHGTFRNLYQNLPKINALRQAGFAILAVEYRGWGRSSVIVPSEQTIVQDALLGFEELRRRQPIGSQRVLYGHSMGSGVAVEIASTLKAPGDYGGIILESALTSFPDVASEASWLGRLVAAFNNERFASIEKISKVQAPLLMLHGTLDTTVPIVLGQKLFDAANAPKQWVSIQGGAHSNLQQIDAPAYQNALQRFKNLYFAGP